MPTETMYDATEYVRLLRAASEALSKARMYGEQHQRWRPAYADLILLDSIGGWTADNDRQGSWAVTVPADDAMTRIVTEDRVVEIPGEFWEWYDEDARVTMEQIPGLLVDVPFGEDE